MIVTLGGAHDQAGVVSRRQLLAAGFTPAQIRAHVAARRWQRITPGPPRLRVEEALLDAAARSARPEDVVDLVLRVVQRRLTTADRLRVVLDGRRGHPWRRLLVDLLADVEDGVRSPLERRWVEDVVRPHGLPVGRLNHADDDGTPRRCGPGCSVEP